MKANLLKVITTILLIITMTMANFILLGFSVVSYAVDALGAENTSHKNVTFSANLKNGEDESTDLKAKMDSTELNLHMKISVKQEGYFNGKITLKNSNFKLKTDILSEGITRIENNVIYLSQINAGETRDILVGIEVTKDDKFNLGILDMESELQIEGIYRDSSEKDIQITGTRTVKLQLVSPYDEQNNGIILESNIITNSVVRYKDSDRRIVQLYVKSGLNGNLFPIKLTEMQLNAPKINDKYPEEVIVASKGTLATNGKTLQEDNWNYNQENGELKISLSNDANENIVTWNKSGNDEFVITYIFAGSDNIGGQTFKASSKIELYDVNKTIMSANYELTPSSEEKNSFVTVEVSNQEQSIYKGKLYSQIDKEFTENVTLNLNFSEISNIVELTEDLSNIGMQNVYSRKTVFNKDNILNVLGENGKIEISNSQTGENIATINKGTEANSDGNIEINYPENVGAIKFNITGSQDKSGQLKFSNTKVIKANDVQTVRNANSINYKLNGYYVLNGLQTEEGENQTIPLESNTSTTELKETQSSAKLEINKKELSTMSVNNDVEIRAILQTREEDKELYKNPKIDITLPSQVQAINVKSIDLLYEDELQISDARMLSDGRTIEISLQGEQTKYKEEAIEGATIIINADLTLDKKAGSSTEQIRLVYTNEDAINYPEGKKQGETSAEINVVSYAGLVTTTTIPQSDIEVINNDGTKNAKLEIGAEQKQITINSEIMNNNSGSISDVKILGTFPTKEAVTENNIETQITELQVTGIDMSKVKIYYTQNANATETLEDNSNGWTEEFNPTAKKYLVVITNMQLQETGMISYNVIIPERLEYNAVAKAGYTISYIDDTTSVRQNVNLDLITLETGAGPVLETELKTISGGEEVSQIKEGEILTYQVITKNTGSEPVESAKVKAVVPDGTVYLEEVIIEVDQGDGESQAGWNEVSDKKEVEFEIGNLLPGQSVVNEYNVRVQKGKANSTISNTAELQYGEVIKDSNEIATQIQQGEMQLGITSVDAENNLQPGYVYRYNIALTNISDSDLNNISVKVNLENATIQQLIYDTIDGEIVTSNTDTIVVENLPAGQSVDIGTYIQVTPFNDAEEKILKVSAKATVDNVEYSTNEKEQNLKSANITINNYSENSGTYVKVGDEITYRITVQNNGESSANNVVIQDKISNNVSVLSVQRNGVELTENNGYTIENNAGEKYIEISDTIEPQTSVEYLVRVVINKGIGNEEAIELNNVAELYLSYVKLAQSSVTHIIQPEYGQTEEPGEPTEPEDPSNPEEPSNTTNNTNTTNTSNNTNTTNTVNPGNPTEPEQPENPEETRIISGVAWFDQNENGQRDENEELLSGIIVRLLNTETNEFLKDSNGNNFTATTNNNGFYTLSNIPQGSYMVIFEYDTSKYVLTTYQKGGIDTQYTSKAVDRTMTINGEEMLVGGTEVITVSEQNISNINIGLKQAKVFDLKLDKYVSKVIVQNSRGTSTLDFGESSLAKAEIDSKLINSTSIVVEYKIKITNEGEVDAYVRKIADYISSDYKFSSELNKDWYQSEGKLYNTSLANERIQPGQSKEITLTVTKEMTENNTGLIPNTAEITEVYNEQGLSDVDSIPGNNVIDEDDLGSADLIVSIKTGQVVATVAIILVSIIVIGTGAFFVTKMVMNRRII